MHQVSRSMRNRLVLSRQTIPQYVAAIVAGLIAALAYFNHIIRPQVGTLLWQTLILVYLAALFAVLAYVLLFRFSILNSQFSISMLLVAPPVIAVALWPPAPLRFHRLEIVATGRKNPEAQASQVWVIDFQGPDGLRTARSALAP